MVVIDAEAQTRAMAADVDFEVRTGEGPVSDWDTRAQRSLTPGDGIEWPLEAALVPRAGDADRVYLVIATARDAAGKAIAQVRAISGYQKGKTLLLLLLFEDECVGKTDACDEAQTCRGGDCVDAHLEPGDLPLYGGERPDAAADDGGGTVGPAMDAGADSGVDGGPVEPPTRPVPTSSTGFGTLGGHRGGGTLTLYDDGFETGERLCTTNGLYCITGAFTP